MREVTPKVFLIGKSQIDTDQCREWLDHIGATEFPVTGQGNPFGETLVQLCGKRCYMSFSTKLNPNLSRVRTDMADFIENILKVGHGSVLEHAVYNFALEGVSRVFTAEMNRHRAGMAISEGSLRFIRFDDIPFWMPTSLQEAASDPAEIRDKKEVSRMGIKAVLANIEAGYKALCKIWADELAPESKFKDKKAITSMLRRIIPLGVATGGVWSGNLRALRHIFAMRCSPEAEEEILLVASLMLKAMIQAEPLFFGDFHCDENGFWKPKYAKV